MEQSAERDVSGLKLTQQVQSSRLTYPDRRPKLLFLAYSFPPLRSTAAIRAWNIAKHLARLGWEVTVVTPHPSVRRYGEGRETVTLQLKDAGIRRLLTGHGWRWLNPEFLKCGNQSLAWLAGGICRKIARQLDIDPHIGWNKAAEEACAALTSNDVDIILATGSPFAAFDLAKRLSERLHRPYVLDYRDPWTGNPHRPRPARRWTVQKEARLLAGCAAATIVSPSWGEAMKRRFDLGEKLHVVTSGYDSEDMSAVKPVRFGHFAIVYAGTFYPPKRVITPVLRAVKRLEERANGTAKEVFFHYYGAHEQHVREEAVRANVVDRVVLHGLVSRAEALSAVKGAGVAVVITSVFDEASKEEQGIITGKIFEPVGLGVPILLISPFGSDAEMVLKETGMGQAFRGGDVDGIAGFFRDLMAGKVVLSGNLAEYSWANLGKRLDRILREALVTNSSTDKT
jgi:glycosyltransferase involved in cell wall biosynthesis